MEKIPCDIILHKCTKNQDHMLYCFLGHFWPFYPPNSQKNEFLPLPFTLLPPYSPKNQNVEKGKQKQQQQQQQKNLEMLLFYNDVPKIIIICYTVPQIWCITDVIIFHFGPFFTF